MRRRKSKVRNKIITLLLATSLVTGIVPMPVMHAQPRDTANEENDQTVDTKQVKIDYITLKDIYEAEDAEVIGAAKTNTDHHGYSGDGFVDNMGNNGNGLKFQVYAEQAGRYTLSIRYSAGHDGDAATLNLYVNEDEKPQTVGLGALGSWDEWWNRNCSVDLKEGENTITLKREDGNHYAANIDYITLDDSNWEFIGDCTGVTGDRTEELTFSCTNAAVKVKACDDKIIKVWCEPTGAFYRRYESFTVLDEDVNPVTLNVTEENGYYEFATDEMIVQINKAPFSITYMDSDRKVLCENQADSFGWNDQNELIINNKIAADEHFWGLGEKIEEFDKTGTSSTMWSTDVLGATADAMVAEIGKGRWYLSDPHFISSKGYAIYFDNTSRTQFDMGETDPDTCSFGSFNPAAAGELCYYFIAGENMRDMTTSFTDLIGKSFFAPQWAYGNMQCHYGYTQERIEEVAKTYREKEIPCDVMFADIEWYQNQCSPTEWNHNNFPDPDGMIAKLKADGYKFGVIDDPNVSAATTSTTDFADGTANNYFIRNIEGNAASAFWPWGGADGEAKSGMSGVVDFFNPEASNWWGNLHNNVLDQGLNSFWLDMNEPARYLPNWAFYNEAGKSYGNIEELHNAYAIAHHKSMFDKLNQNEESRPFLLTRSGFTGSQRYVSPWTGDIRSDWESMSQQLRLGLGLSMSGFSYWGFDIGGFFGNFTDDQYKRWVELATFTPVHRFHYANWDEGEGNGQAYTGIGKEPWNFGSEEISRNQINMRYQLIPYMYSCTADSVIGTGLEGAKGKGTGIPLARPMVMEYFNDDDTYNMDSQFMCGPSLLVAPVVEDSDKKQVYFPEGTWYDYSDGKTTFTGGTIEYDAPIDKLPVFVKAGAILPKAPVMQYVGEKPIDVLTLDVYPLAENGTSSFVYYEDDGESQEYQQGMYATTKYSSTVNKSDDSTELKFSIGKREGDYASQVDARSYLLQFHKTAFDRIQVAVDGIDLTAVTSTEELEAADSGYFVDEASEICYVKMQDDALEHEVTVKSEPEVQEPMEIALVNGGFEDGDLTGWMSWDLSGNSAGVDGNDPYSGMYKCYFFNPVSYAQSIHQEVTGLADGKYKVSAYVKITNEDSDICRMELGKYDKNDENASYNLELIRSDEYRLWEQEVTVTSGKLDIGFFCESAGGTSVQIDDVKLWKIE